MINEDKPKLNSYINVLVRILNLPKNQSPFNTSEKEFLNQIKLKFEILKYKRKKFHQLAPYSENDVRDMLANFDLLV